MVTGLSAGAPFWWTAASKDGVSDDPPSNDVSDFTCAGDTLTTTTSRGSTTYTRM